MFSQKPRRGMLDFGVYYRGLTEQFQLFWHLKVESHSGIRKGGLCRLWQRGWILG